MTSPYSTKVIKQGATFQETIPASLAQGLGLSNLIGVSVASSVVTVDGIEHHLTVAIPDPSALTFNLSSETIRWKLGDANWDIKFTLQSGKVLYSPTVPVRVAKHYTS
jgi:hypothetical protein